MPTIQDVTAILQAVNSVEPLILGLIAMLKAKGDTRTDDEIVAEALATAQDTQTLTEQDMKPE